jgi:thioredoxin reductase (NADPH)
VCLDDRFFHLLSSIFYPLWLLRQPRYELSWLAVPCLVLAAGCAVGPDYRPPEASPPPHWTSDLAGGETNGPVDLAAWWKIFGDTNLDSLMTTALHSNLTLADAAEIGCRALIIATGIAFRKLDVPGLEKLNGAGVYYYAPMSEAFSYRDGNIYIVGGANSAGQAAMYFSKLARQVTMLVRGESLSDTMSQYLENQLAVTKNIAVRFNSSVIAVAGVDRCENITIQNNKTLAQETISASALLIYAGAVPRTDWLAGVVERDSQGYLISGQHLIREGRRPAGWTADRDPFYLETSVPGIFVAGDVRHRSAKGVTSGVGEGAMAVKLVHEYLGLL